MNLGTVPIQIGTIGKARVVIYSGNNLGGWSTLTLSPSTTRWAEALRRRLRHAFRASGAATSLSMIQAIGNTTVYSSAVQHAIWTRTGVTVLWHSGVVTLNAAFFKPTMILIMFVIWWNKWKKKLSNGFIEFNCLVFFCFFLPMPLCQDSGSSSKLLSCLFFLSLLIPLSLLKCTKFLSLLFNKW